MDSIFQQLLQDPKILQMKQYYQHGSITTYEHCKQVALYSKHINDKYHLHLDNQVLLIGGLLHDFYLYDWHIKDKSHQLHGYSHARVASENAMKYYHVNKDIENVIKTHMWPLNITKIPKSKEAWLICIVDKYLSLIETLFYRKGKTYEKTQ